MVQEFHVVRCFKCQSFQVQQVKKATRWSCKLCGEKQSLLKEFGRGSGADCRRHVQKLNAMRGAVMDEQEHHTWSLWEQVDEAEEDRDDQLHQNQVSRWSKFLDAPKEANPEEDLDGNNMIDRKRKRSCTPEQLKCSSMSPVRLPGTSRATSPNQTNSPSKKSNNLPCLKTGPVFRWACFLSSDCLVHEGEVPPVGGVIDHSSHIIKTSQPLLPVSSMFESGRDFSFDEFLSEPTQKEKLNTEPGCFNVKCSGQFEGQRL
ncbi:MRN complex-interacting protein isoform X2 [Anabas testudineus]|uniref:MRN complex-interacting protein isoform X2 n=1 Tax=Anabas testudineus TaxID=64144 RepID=UPI000E458C59|nr:MRN complex-interacting protein isoform X2 [Anabas testudineus]